MRSSRLLFNKNGLLLSAKPLCKTRLVIAVAVLSLTFLLVPVRAASGSIPLLTCGNTAATWRHTPVTVRIDNLAGLSSSQVTAVSSAVQEWSNALLNGGFTGYTLTLVSGSADIIIQLYYKITPGYILGATSISCSGTSLSGANIQLGLKGLSLTGIQNVASHELGHALGLAHANLKADLMYASFDHTERKTLTCPSNLDVGGINFAYSSYPTTILSYQVTIWQQLQC